jgi:hypothetical protein
MCKKKEKSPNHPQQDLSHIWLSIKIVFFCKSFYILATWLNDVYKHGNLLDLSSKKFIFIFLFFIFIFWQKGEYLEKKTEKKNPEWPKICHWKKHWSSPDSADFLQQILFLNFQPKKIWEFIFPGVNSIILIIFLMKI